MPKVDTATRILDRIASPWNGVEWHGYRPVYPVDSTPYYAGRWTALREDGVHFFAVCTVPVADFSASELAQMIELHKEQGREYLDTFAHCACIVGSPCDLHKLPEVEDA